MHQIRYGRAVALDIFNDTTTDDLDLLEFKDDGIWPVDGLLYWHPLTALDAPGSPDPRSTPALPFPFSAEELAAFMLGGVGYFTQQYFDEWATGPAESVLSSLPPGAIKAREALRAAYEAYRRAEKIVGPLNPTFEEAAQEKRRIAAATAAALRQAGGLEAVGNSQLAREQKLAAIKARSLATSEEKSWQHKMAAQLLNAGQAEPAYAPQAGRQTWSPERIAELRTYCARTSRSSAARKYGISRQRVSELLDKPLKDEGAPGKAGYSAFNQGKK